MDSLTHYHPHNAGEDRVSRPDLVQQLATHALRNIKNAHHVLKTIVFAMSPAVPVFKDKYRAFGNKIFIFLSWSDFDKRKKY